MVSCFENIHRCIWEAFFLQDTSLCSLYFKNNRARTEESVHSPSAISTASRMCKCTAKYASSGSPCFIPLWHHCHFTPPFDLCLCYFGLIPVAGCALEHCQECTKGIWTRFRGGVLNINCTSYCAFTVQIDNTDLQPKTSIDEISLLWLFRGYWTRIWY